MTIIYCN